MGDKVVGRNCIDVLLVPLRQLGELSFRPPQGTEHGAAPSLNHVAEESAASQVASSNGVVPDVPILYQARVDGGRVFIAKDQVPSFLLDNGVTIMTAQELEKLLLSELGDSMQLIQCACVEQRSAGGKTLAGRLGAAGSGALRPGDVKLQLKMEQDFKVYRDDPASFEDRLKSAMMDALGLDPEQLPNAKRHIIIEEVWEGSIVVRLIIQGCILAAAAFVLFAWWQEDRKARSAPGAPPQQRSRPEPRPPRQEAPPQPQQQSGAAGPATASDAGLHPSAAAGPCYHLCRCGVLVPAHEQIEGRQLQPQRLGQVASSLPAHRQTRSPVAAGHVAAPLVRRPLAEVRLVNHPNDDGWEIVGQIDTRPKCFLTSTIFQTSMDTYATAAKLKEYDTVLSASGKQLTVVSKEVHGKSRRKLVTIITAQSVLTVTADHRVVVQGGAGIPTEKPAVDLRAGDYVYCGLRAQKVSRVVPFEKAVEVVEIGFDPDDPVETFNALRWGILSKGRRRAWVISHFGNLGPHSVDMVQVDAGGCKQRSKSL